MTKNRTFRPDQSGKAKSTFEKARKIIYASQTNCGICGRPVNFDKRFPDPWSPTLDHIIPISKGGDPASLNNLQLAHFRCNRIKSTRTAEYRTETPKVSNRDLPLSCDWSTIFETQEHTGGTNP